MFEVSDQQGNCHSIAGMKVLVVEDKVVNLSVLMKLLNEIGLNITIAPDGEVALNLIPKLKPDLILLDIMLPEMDGFEVCIKVKADEATKNIPIIFITGKTDNEDIMRGFAVGGVDYITKPFNPNETLARVQTQLKLQAVTKQLIENSKRLEESNRELEDFCSFVSHDLKAPLRKIMYFEGRLSEECSELLDETGEKYLSKIQDSTTRMGQFIDDLLEFSKITFAAKEFKPVDLNIIVQKVLENLEVHIKQVNGTVNVQELPSVEANPIQLSQVFLNLISNALKFSRIDVAPIINVQSERTGDGTIKIMVQDNGIGIDCKSLKRIFNPFQRLNQHKAYKGSGMGLAICKKIVDGYQGTIEVESQLDQGTQFTIVWPKPKMVK
ncbi:MAG: response regulator [Nitrospina sp.]|jgi:two-component system, sensor histidine kinase and response regulator|nr:response regulator [Nitrospina sp.]